MAVRGIALFLAAVISCSPDDGDSRGPRAGGEAGADSQAGSGGGDQAGTTGRGGSGTEGGQAGSGGDAAGGEDSVAGSSGGEGGAFDHACPACRLLRSVSWSNRDTFVSDGTSVFVRGGDSSDPVYAVDIDGNNPRTITIPDCDDAQRGAQVHGGFVYFRPVLVGSSTTWISRWQIPEPAAAEASCETVLTNPEDEGIANFFIDGDTLLATFHDTSTAGTLVGLELSNLKDTVILDLTSIRVAAVDATSYFGTDNPAAGSASYRILRLDRESLETTVLETFVGVPDVLHVDDQFLYYHSDGELFRLPKDAAEETSATHIAGPENAFWMGVDGADVVYFEYAEPSIYRMPLAGGDVTRIPTGPDGMRALIWDEQNYYFLASAAPPDQDSGYQLWALEK